MVVGGSSELKISLGDIFKKFNRAPITQAVFSEHTSPRTRDEPSGAEDANGKRPPSLQDEAAHANFQTYGVSGKLQERAVNGKVWEQEEQDECRSGYDKPSDVQPECKLKPAQVDKERKRNGEVSRQGGTLGRSSVLNKLVGEQLEKKLSSILSEKLQQGRQNGDVSEQGGMLEESNILNETSHEQLKKDLSLIRSEKLKERRLNGEMTEQRGMLEGKGVSKTDLQAEEISSGQRQKPSQDKRLDNTTCEEFGEYGDRDVLNVRNSDLLISEVRSTPCEKSFQEDEPTDNITTPNGKEIRDLINKSILNNRCGLGLKRVDLKPQQKQLQQQQQSQEKTHEQCSVESVDNEDAAAVLTVSANPNACSLEYFDSDESAQDDESMRSVVWNGVMEELRERAAAKKAASFRLLNRSNKSSPPTPRTPNHTVENVIKDDKSNFTQNKSSMKQAPTIDLSRDSINSQACVPVSSCNSEPQPDQKQPVQRSRRRQCTVNKGANPASQDHSTEHTEKPVTMSKSLESTQLEQPLRCETTGLCEVDRRCMSKSQSPTKPACASSPISCPSLQTTPLQPLNKSVGGDRPLDAQRVGNQAISPVIPSPTKDNMLCSSKMVITLSSGWGKKSCESTPTTTKQLSRSTSQVSISETTPINQSVHAAVPPACSNGNLSPIGSVSMESLQVKQERSNDGSGSVSEDVNELRNKEVSKLIFTLSGPTSPTTNTAGKALKICNASTNICQGSTANAMQKQSIPDNAYAKVEKVVGRPLISPTSGEVYVVKDSINQGQAPTEFTFTVEQGKSTPIQITKCNQLNWVSDDDSNIMTEDQEPSRTHRIQDDQLQSNRASKLEFKNVTDAGSQPKQEPRKPQGATDLGSNKKGMDLDSKGSYRQSAAAAASSNKRPRAPLNSSGREYGVGGPRVPPGSGGCVGGLRSAWEQWSDDYTERQKLNPFSQRFDMEQALSTLPQKGERGYGRPKEGTRTAERAARAQQDVRKEMLEMCYLIRRIGEPGSDGRKQIAFGRLFHTYARVSDKLVGILLRARKHGLVDFEGEMLWQGRDDHVQIKLLC